MRCGARDAALLSRSRHSYVEFDFDQAVDIRQRFHRHAFESNDGVVTYAAAVTSVVLPTILELFGHRDLNTTMIPHVRAELGRARRVESTVVSWGGAWTPVSLQSCGSTGAYALSSSAYPAGVPWLIPRTSAAGHWLSKQIEPGPLARYTAAAVQLSGYRVEPTARWPDRTGQS
jgi:hypothetical protein